MPSSLKLEIIAPERVFYKGDVKMVVVRTLLGEEAFLPGHLPAVKLLGTGELAIQEVGTETLKIASISGGFVDVNDGVIIYTDRAEWPEEIDKARAAKAKEIAQKWLSENIGASDADKEEYNLSLRRSNSRISVAEGGRRGK